MSCHQDRFSFSRVLAVCAGHGLIVLTLSYSSLASAQTANTLEPYQRGSVDLSSTEIQSWGITDTDWQAYQALMTGPAGLHYRHLSPAFVLGLYAKNVGDRERYARIVFYEERERLDNLFEFNRAYARIARKEGRPVFDQQYLADEHPQHSPLSVASDPPLVFVKDGCAQCDYTVNELVRRGTHFDIYFVGAQDDLDINRWATRIKLPPQIVSSRQVTLNHDSGLLSRSQHANNELPLIFSDGSLRELITLKQVK